MRSAAAPGPDAAGSGRLTEFEALVAAAPSALDAIPAAVIHLRSRRAGGVLQPGSDAALGPRSCPGVSTGTVLWFPSALSARRHAFAA